MNNKILPYKQLKTAHTYKQCIISFIFPFPDCFIKVQNCFSHISSNTSVYMNCLSALLFQVCLCSSKPYSACFLTPKMKRSFQENHSRRCLFTQGLYAYIFFNISCAHVGVFTSLQILSWTKAFTLECLQAKGRANATKGCFYEWGSCGFILLQRFMHLGAMLHCLNGTFLLWYDFIFSLVQESCIKHFLSMGEKKHWLCSYSTVSQSINAQQVLYSF